MEIKDAYIKLFSDLFTRGEMLKAEQLLLHCLPLSLEEDKDIEKIKKEANDKELTKKEKKELTEDFDQQTKGLLQHAWEQTTERLPSLESFKFPPLNELITPPLNE